jgi:nitrate reductase delta subunit
MNAYEALARGYCYPNPGHLAELVAAGEMIPAGTARRSFRRFTGLLAELSLSEWEELHTRTLDLSPLFAPYVGYVTWGESYQRGAFLASMNRAEAEAEIDPDGELPDHLDPVLRYIGRVADPLPELLEVLAPSVDKMLMALKKAEPGNPYVHLLAATRRVVPTEASSVEGAK